MTNYTASYAWFQTLKDLVQQGRPVAPRGQQTLELPQHTMRVDMRQPVVVVDARKVSEKFLGAEAHWILTGSDRVEDIAPFNKNIAKYSDDGEVFFGAYGPKILAQLDFVVSKLIEDADTRQAGLNIWRENPPATKDMPCTVSMFFNIRDGNQLQMHVFMRSSDIWLGVPYDVFNFSMVAHLVCCWYNERLHERDSRMTLQPGTLHLTAASRHLYLANMEAASDVLKQGIIWRMVEPTPVNYFTSEQKLLEGLDAIRHENTDAMWWRNEV